MKYKKRIIAVFIPLILLLIPLIAMQFTNEVNWTLGDFVIAGVLLSGAGLLCEFILRKVNKPNYRIISYVTVLIVFLLIWAQLSVGLFGTLFGGD